MAENSLQETRVAHSPGPWSFEPVPPEAHADPDLNVPQDTAFWIVESSPAGEVLAGVEQTSRGEGEANARLMAAAPKLLDALKTTAGNIRSLGPAGAIPTPYEHWLRVVDDAIAKAEGR
jgi:hypothetical protein